MKILKNNKITSEKADELIQKYYEGETTCQEEDLLRIFFKQKNLPSKYDVEKNIFGYFENPTKIKNTTVPHRTFYRNVAVAASIAFIIGFTVYKNFPQHQNYAYIDGEKITNSEKIESLANISLTEVSVENNNVLEEQLDQVIDTGF